MVCSDVALGICAFGLLFHLTEAQPYFLERLADLPGTASARKKASASFRAISLQ
jgi:hypothetical protein